MKIIEEFYKELYAIKLLKDFARKKILNCLNEHIISRAIIKLLTSITMNEIKMIIQCAILKKSLENDDFFFEYYKMLTFHSKKNENENHSLMIRRLINLFNYVQKKEVISQD